MTIERTTAEHAEAAAPANSAVPAEVWLPAWDGPAYAANTAHHRAHDAWFFRAFPVRATDRVLDLGCGSGDFTRIVAEQVPDGEVVGLDGSASMVAEAARAAGPNQTFEVGPLQELPRLLPSPRHDASFDAVMSRAVMHWLPASDQAGVLAEAARLLRPGGWLRIECGGAGNVSAMLRVLDPISVAFGGPATPWTFLDAGTYLDLVEQAGFVLGDDGYVMTVAQRRPFDRASLVGWIESQCIEAYAEGIDPGRRDGFREAVLTRVDDFRRPDGSFDQTFVRLDLLVRKP